MLNPALIAAVTAGAATEYTRRAGESMPYAYAFLINPLVLDHDTRQALPKRTTSHLATWVIDNEVIVAGFAARARSLAGLVREGLRYGIRCGSLEISEGALQGRLGVGVRPAEVGDIADIVAKAGFLGRWLTKLERPATVFALLGVKP